MTWRGLTEWNRKILDLPPEVARTMEKSVAKSGDEFVALAKRNVKTDVEAPHLRDSIRVQPGLKAMSVKVLAGDETRDYAGPVEYGHMKGATHVRGQPFFWPAYRVIKKRHSRRMIRELKKTLQMIWSR